MRNETETPVKRKKRARLIPAGLRREEAAAFCGVSVSLWDRLAAAEKVPAPVRLAGAVLWSRHVLREWLAKGAPDRAKWNAICAARDSSKRR